MNESLDIVINKFCKWMLRSINIEIQIIYHPNDLNNFIVIRMIIPGYQIHVSDIQQFLDQEDPHIQRFLNTRPLGSNYFGDFTPGSDRISDVYFYRSNSQTHTLKNLASISQISQRHMVIVSVHQYECLNQIIGSNPELGFTIKNKITPYDYNTENVFGYSIKVSVLVRIIGSQDLNNIKKIISEKGYGKFYDSIPLESNLGRLSGWTKYNSETYSETKHSFYEHAFMIPFDTGTRFSTTTTGTILDHRVIVSKQQLGSMDQIIENENMHGNQIGLKDIGLIIRYNNYVKESETHHCVVS
jgi:hypothetical protein